MKTGNDSMAMLDNEFRGYLEGDRVNRFFEAFEVKFAAGHWCAGGFADRFAPKGYNPDLAESIIAQADRVAAAGISGIEFHENLFQDREGGKDETLIGRTREHLDKIGLRATNMNINLWSDPYWKFGGLTNPDPQKRREAIELSCRGAEIALELGCSCVSLWPGADGFDYNFEVNYGTILKYFIEGCLEINRKAGELGLNFGIEAKMKEPREGHMIVPTTHCAVLMARKVNEACGGSNMGVSIDYGHEMMNGLEPAFNLYAAVEFGVPVVNFHVNAAKWRSNDEDRIAGTANIWQMVDFCYAAIDTGYRGWFGEDQFTYRVDPVRGMSLSRELFANCLKKALLIRRKKEELIAAQSTGEADRTIDIVKREIIG